MASLLGEKPAHLRHYLDLARFIYLDVRQDPVQHFDLRTSISTVTDSLIRPIASTGDRFMTRSSTGSYFLYF